MIKFASRRLWPVLALAVAVLPALSGYDPDAAAQAQLLTKSAVLQFDKHLQELGTATYQQFKGVAGARVASEAHFNEMKEHLQNLYKGMKVSHSFIGHDGHTVDVVAIDQQPSLRHPLLKNHKVQHTAPTVQLTPKAAGAQKNPNNIQGLPTHLAKGMKDSQGNEMYSPPGSIAIRRLTLAELTKFGSLKEYFQKSIAGSRHPLAKPALQKPDAPGTTSHRYAYTYQTVNNFGGSSWLNLWDPTPASHEFSLSQHWYSGGNPLQTVEGGWQVYPDKYGHSRPVLFIYWTADNYNKTGAYNLDSPGFVQVNHSFVIGGAWSKYSTTGGTQWGFKMIWYRDPANGNWWLFLQGAGDQVAVGYYPRELFGSGQMSKYATEITYGGEVTGTADKSGQTYTGQMGSGAFANTGWQHAAFHKDIYYFPTGGNSAWANLTGVQTNPSLYTVDVHNTGGGNWGTYFYFGGPGGK
jgi:hypothetical protein